MPVARVRTCCYLVFGKELCRDCAESRSMRTSARTVHVRGRTDFLRITGIWAHATSRAGLPQLLLKYVARLERRNPGESAEIAVAMEHRQTVAQRTRGNEAIDA